MTCGKTDLSEKYKLRVTLEDYATGELLDSTCINMPYHGAAYFASDQSVADTMIYIAGQTARGLVGAWLKAKGDWP